MNSQVIRFAAYFGAFYLTLGVFLPYFPVWLEGRGISAEWIGWIGAAGYAGRLLVSPLGARLSDRAKFQRRPIAALALVSLVAFIMHLPVSSPWPLLALALLASAGFFGQIPLADAFAMRESRAGAIPFGPVRAFGSAAFVLANFAAGALLDLTGSESVMVFVSTGAALIVLTAFALPNGKSEGEVPDRRIDWVQFGRMVRGPFGLALLASACVQGAHGFYYFFSAIAWAEMGHSQLIIGALWATGVVIEIVFLWWSGKGILARLTPAQLLGLGAAGSIIRWGFTALGPPLPVLFGLQLLHALTFAATYLGFLRFAIDSIPESHTATAQAVNSALSGGLVMALAAAVSGYFYAWVGVGGFALMLFPSIIGLIAAIALHRVSALPQREKID
ncbi:MAG: MFS transporter [Alphaproteobacteria bacterium]|nr:MFS transporter [Alphaproteobacteria bacterium]